MSVSPPSNNRPHHASRGCGVLTPGQWKLVAANLHLSERELQVVHGVFDDLKEAAIAQRLGISSHTVHTHLERMYRKLNVNGRCQLIIEVLGEGAHLRDGVDGEA